nr:hypothetical protein RTCK_00365 [Rhizobium sp. TCK]
MKRGELRWNERERGWEVFIPSNAFKNSGSSFFGQKPFRLVLPDLLDLYTHLNAYIERHRKVLLGRAPDPGTLFVKTVKTTSVDAAYNETTFYEAWRLAIQRYTASTILTPVALPSKSSFPTVLITSETSWPLIF